MSDIPSDLLPEILSRLPADSLLRFRSVCKEWLRIIDDPSFIKAHTHNQLYCRTHTLLVRNQALLHSFSLDSLNFIKGPQMIDAIQFQQLIPPLLSSSLFDVASCNGLILISAKDMENWVIWNPLTNECRELPESSDGDRYAFGFGYDPDADEYKVVRIDEEETLVYSLKSHSWTSIEGCPELPDDRRGTFWNGTLYWVYKYLDAIVALDLSTESYYELSLPPYNTLGSYGFRLDALDGCLICSLNYPVMNHYSGWVMKDNGWVELFSVSYPATYTVCLVAYLSSKQQVVLQHKSGFLLFSIRDKSLLEFSAHDLPEMMSCLICPGSLVRLNDGGSGAGITLSRKRLKFCARAVGEQCCPDNAKLERSQVSGL
ncbi:hypothetical protein ACS0TY_030271 [Phlomoides rotata]